MSSIEQLLTRRSIRKYKDEPVSEQVFQSILEAGRLSPSAVNKQPWHFVVIKNQEAKEACSFGGYNKWTSDSDFIIVGCYKPSEVIMEHLTIMDVTIALQNMVCVSWLQGVGSCWIGAWDDSKLRRVLELPADSKIVALVSFGVPDGVPNQPNKKPLKEIIHYDTW